MSYQHFKPIVISERAAGGLKQSTVDRDAPGVYVSDEPDTIVTAFEQPRYFDRVV